MKNVYKDAENAEHLNTFFLSAFKTWRSHSISKVTPSLKIHRNRYWRQFSNMVNIKASLLSIMSPMGQHFSFHLLVWIMYFSTLGNQKKILKIEFITYFSSCNIGWHLLTTKIPRSYFNLRLRPLSSCQFYQIVLISLVTKLMPWLEVFLSKTTLLYLNFSLLIPSLD